MSDKISIRVNGDSMWPTLREGQVVEGTRTHDATVGDIIVFNHPRTNRILIKRVVREENGFFFVTGDNPDPTESQDSNNFGAIERSTIIAVISP